MSEIDWSNLPEMNWIQIFGYLDINSLLKITETCSKFADLFAKIEKLNDKVRIVLKVSDNLAKTLTKLEESKRRYRNLKVMGSKWDDYGIKTDDAVKIGKMFSSTVVDLILGHCTSIFDLETLLTPFDKLKNCSFQFFILYEYRRTKRHDYRYSNEQQENLIKTPSPSVNIERIEFSTCAFLCMHIFRNATNLRAITFKGLWEKDWNRLEEFVMKQKNLKELYFDDCYYHLGQPASFKTNLLYKIPFQLEKFSLTKAKWENIEKASDFFHSQRNLKSIELSLKDYDEEVWFNLIFKQMLPQSKNLRSISISTCLPKESECFGPKWPIVTDDILKMRIASCNGLFSPNITKLKYEKGREEKTNAFMQSFVEIFPNLRTLHLDYFLNKEELRLISSFEHLESLSFGSKASDLKEIQVTSKSLTTMKFRSLERPSITLDRVKYHDRPYYDKYGMSLGEKLKKVLSFYDEEASLANFDCLKAFLDRHPTIRHLELDTPRISELSSYRIDEILAEHLPNLESFSDKFTFIDPTTLRRILNKLKMMRSLHVRVWKNNQKEVQEICDSLNVGIQFQEIRAVYEKRIIKILEFRTWFSNKDFPLWETGPLYELDLF